MCGIHSTQVQAIARSIVGFSICVSTKNYLAGLLIHLGTLIMNTGWEYAKEELNFHVKELIIMRTRTNGRLALICVTYIYLHDLIQNVWPYPHLIEKRYQVSQGYGNLHAHDGGSCVIPPLDEVCLWKEKSAENVKKERVNKMRGN